jgi:hypothetical protein
LKTADFFKVSTAEIPQDDIETMDTDDVEAINREVRDRDRDRDRVKDRVS